MNVRKAFQKVYEPSNVGEFLTEDKDALCKIKDELGKLINDPNKPIDKISRFHLANFIKYDLEEFINKLQ